MAHARGPLPRHVRHRVHDREGPAVDPADAGGQAHRVRRMGHGLRDARRGPDRRGRGAAARRRQPTGGAVQAAGRCDRRRTDRDRAQRIARRGHRRGGVHRRRGAGARTGGGAGHPGPSRDHAGRLPRHDRGPGHPDERRWDELARRRGGARRGHPGGVRRRRDQAPGGRRAVHRERHRRARGRRHHDRRVQRQRLRGRTAAPGIAAREGAAGGRGRAPGTAVAFVRALDDDRRRAAPVAGSRQRRHPRPVDERPRARRRGHRPLPHRAHVPRGGACARGPQDDLRRDGGGGTGGLRRPACPCSRTTSWASSPR